MFWLFWLKIHTENIPTIVVRFCRFRDGGRNSMNAKKGQWHSTWPEKIRLISADILRLTSLEPLYSNWIVKQSRIAHGSYRTNHRPTKLYTWYVCWKAPRQQVALRVFGYLYWNYRWFKWPLAIRDLVVSVVGYSSQVPHKLLRMHIKSCCVATVYTFYLSSTSWMHVARVSCWDLLSRGLVLWRTFVCY